MSRGKNTRGQHVGNKSVPNKVDVVNLSASSYTAPIVEVVDTYDWVPYGLDNNYFNDLIGYYKGSTTTESIVNGISSLIYGKGLVASDAGQSEDKAAQWAQLKAIIKDKELKKVIFDRKLLGMAALQVVYVKGKKGKVAKVTHWRMDTLRAAKVEDKEIKRYYYSPDWSKVKTGEEVDSFPAFGQGNGVQPEIYIIQPYITGEFYYTQPDYAASLPYAEIESQVGDYLLNTVKSGFSGNLLINVGGKVPSQDQQRAQNRAFKEKFGGATGDKLIVQYGQDEKSKTTIQRLDSDNSSDVYEYVSNECRAKITEAHRITSPLLIGMRSTGNGFSSNAEEMRTAALLLDANVVNEFRDEITEAVEDILSLNGITLDLSFASSLPKDFLEEEGIKEENDKDSEALNEEASEFLDDYNNKNN